MENDRTDQTNMYNFDDELMVDVARGMESRLLSRARRVVTVAGMTNVVDRGLGNDQVVTVFTTEIMINGNHRLSDHDVVHAVVVSVMRHVVVVVGTYSTVIGCVVCFLGDMNKSRGAVPRAFRSRN